MAKILVVDDDTAIRRILTRLLDAEGYDVVGAADGLSAYSRAISDRPDIILLDLLMPSMDGLEVLRELKENPETMSIPVIILTGKRLPEYELKATRAGALDFITKPWASGEIEDRVRMALTYLDVRKTNAGLAAVNSEATSQPYSVRPGAPDTSRSS